MNRKIIHKGPLLSNSGELNELGYSTYLIKDYNRENIATSKLRIKEWDYYYFGDDEYGVALTIADNGYMGLVSAHILDFKNKEFTNKANMFWFPLGKTKLPSSSIKGNVSKQGKNYKTSFIHENDKRHLKMEMKDMNKKPFKVDVYLKETSENSLVITTPFKKKKHFYYNQKINNMKVEGSFTFGDISHTFKDKSFGVLDWGRGVWEYKNAWYWSSLSGMDDKGNIIGFNLGYGFGDTTASSENMLFVNDKAYKFDDVIFKIPYLKNTKKFDYLSNWHIHSKDGKINLSFVPILDRHDKSNALIISQDAHQVFGKFFGKFIVDNKEFEIKNMLGFAEYVKNKW